MFKVKSRSRFTNTNIFDISLFLFLLFSYYAVLFTIWNSRRQAEPNEEFTLLEDKEFTTYASILKSENALESLIKAYNEEQKIINQEKYGPLTKDSLIIIVQVHRGYPYLKNLIDSLSRSQNISDTMLIFSHDYYDVAINELVQSIGFCKVMQIFYPYSVKTKQFPRDSENYCPNISKLKAISKNCSKNVPYSDDYGNYGEAELTDVEVKHHWWWKINMVFDGLDISKNFDGPVLFLEDDYHLVPDFIYMIKKLQTIQSTSCPSCKISSLGTHSANTLSDHGRVNITHLNWSNMGLVFDRKFWNEIKKCDYLFCTYNNHNWDQTMQTVTDVCLSKGSQMMVLNSPRVFHVSCCVVGEQQDCDAIKMIEKIEMVIDESAKELYPTTITTEYVTENKSKKGRIDGVGWANERNQQLCLHISTRYSY